MPNRGSFDAAGHNEFRWHTYPKGRGMRRLDAVDAAWWSDAGALLGIELPNLAAVGSGLTVSHSAPLLTSMQTHRGSAVPSCSMDPTTRSPSGRRRTPRGTSISGPMRAI